LERKQVIVIVGAGFVGHLVKSHLGDQAMLLTGYFRSIHDLRTALKPLRPTVVINSALLGTSASIEKLAPSSPEWTEHVLSNVLLPEWLALLAEELDYRLVHFSTLMFLDWPGELNNGDTSGYNEVTGLVKNPAGLPVYTLMKWWAEQRLIHQRPSAVNPERIMIIRMHLLFSGIPHQRNLFSRMPRFTSFTTEPVSMTDMDGCIRVIGQLLAEPKAAGIFHCVNPGYLAPLRVAEIMQEEGLIPAGQVLGRSTLAKIAQDSGIPQPRVVAHSSRLPEFGITMEPIEAAARKSVRALASAL
jgi:dTDP-4-dehydrorhamnose reductase